MSLNWIKITERCLKLLPIIRVTDSINKKIFFRAAEGIKIINKLDDEVFTTVISYVHKNMSPDETDDDNRGLEELEQLVKVDRQDFLLLIKTLSYILKRASTFIMNPSKFQQELKQKLQLQDSKIDVIMKLWIKNLKPIMDNLEIESGGSRELDDVNWELKVQLSSEAQQKEKTPIAMLQLGMNTGEPVNLEICHSELLNLYNQLETIQNELDLLRSK